MTFLQALRYFLREALVSLARSWKVSGLAVLTIAVSLFVGGAFLLVSSNLDRLVEQAREDSKVIVYFDTEVAPERVQEMAGALAAEPWVDGVEVVDQTEAARRFRETFPGLADMVPTDGSMGTDNRTALPSSLEIAVDGSWEESERRRRLEELRGAPDVDMVDDDQEWLGQLGAVVAVVRSLGLALGAVLLGAALFTIASVIRLTAHLYREEISIMRLVGATEFFIRGPFYVEGLLQGLAGSLVALAALGIAFRVALARAAEGLVGSVLLSSFLSLDQMLLLVGLGTGAGLGGAVLSLRRERLGEPPEDEGDEPVP